MIKFIDLELMFRMVAAMSDKFMTVAAQMSQSARPPSSS